MGLGGSFAEPHRQLVVSVNPGLSKAQPFPAAPVRQASTERHVLTIGAVVPLAAVKLAYGPPKSSHSKFLTCPWSRQLGHLKSRKGQHQQLSSQSGSGGSRCVLRDIDGDEDGFGLGTDTAGTPEARDAVCCGRVCAAAVRESVQKRRRTTA